MAGVPLTEFICVCLIAAKHLAMPPRLRLKADGDPSSAGSAGVALIVAVVSASLARAELSASMSVTKAERHMAASVMIT